MAQRSKTSAEQSLKQSQETIWEMANKHMKNAQHLLLLGFPCGSAGKESACNEGDLGLISGLGRSPGEGIGDPLQYSGLENPMDTTVHGATETDTTEPLSLSL